MKKTIFWVLFAIGIFLVLVMLGIFFGISRTTTTSEDKDLDSYGGIQPSVTSEYERSAEDSYMETPTYNNAQGSKVQKTGTVTFLVNDIDTAVDSLESINTKYLGEVTNIYDYGRGNDRVVQLTIKVPVDSFEKYYEDLKTLDGELFYANIGTNDLTEQYIDITSRLENLKSVETQLAEILKSATSVTDILAVQKELNVVRGDIESYEAQKRYFDNQTDYSYISLTFNIDKEGLNISDEPWKPGGEFRAALNALVSVLKGLVNTTIWALVFSPIVLIPVGIVLFVVKRKKK